MNRRVERADGLFDPAQRRLMRGRDRRRDRLVARRQRLDLALIALVDRPRLDRRLVDGPSAVLALEFEIDDAEMASPEAGHDGGNAVEPPGDGVDALEPFVILAGKHPVRMAGHHHVDPRHGGEVEGGALLAFDIGADP